MVRGRLARLVLVLALDLVLGRALVLDLDLDLVLAARRSSPWSAGGLARTVPV